MKINCVCPMCGEKNLETQSEVVWCTNLDSERSGRPCQYGFGTGEKTLSDLTRILNADGAIPAISDEKGEL